MAARHGWRENCVLPRAAGEIARPTCIPSGRTIDFFVVPVHLQQAAGAEHVLVGEPIPTHRPVLLELNLVKDLPPVPVLKVPAAFPGAAAAKPEPGDTALAEDVLRETGCKWRRAAAAGDNEQLWAIWSRAAEVS